MEFTFLTQIVLGLIQGITEWLPISSSGMTSLFLARVENVTNIETLLRTTLFLHFGTFFAALVYFKQDVKQLFTTLFKYKEANHEEQKTLKFLLIATIITGILGLIILKGLTTFANNFEVGETTITVFVGCLLLVTGGMQLRKKQHQHVRTEKHLNWKDGSIAGIAQGLASFPGISRSGITVSTLLLRKINDTSALRLSFLMSLPIVLLGNILLNIQHITFIAGLFWALLASFIFGLLTIHILIKVSKKINFALFIILFGILMIASVFI